MVENVVMALVTGLVIPIAKELWDERKAKAKAAEAAPPMAAAAAVGSSAPAPVAAAPQPQAQPQPRRAGGGLGLALFRLIVAGALGLILAFALLSMVDAESLESEDFTASEAMVSALCIGALWFVLGKVGPLKSGN